LCACFRRERPNVSRPFGGPFQRARRRFRLPFGRPVGGGGCSWRAGRLQPQTVCGALLHTLCTAPYTVCSVHCASYTVCSAQRRQSSGPAWAKKSTKLDNWRPIGRLGAALFRPGAQDSALSLPLPLPLSLGRPLISSGNKLSGALLPCAAALAGFPFHLGRQLVAILPPVCPPTCSQASQPTTYTQGPTVGDLCGLLLCELLLCASIWGRHWKADCSAHVSDSGKFFIRRQTSAASLMRRPDVQP